MTKTTYQQLTAPVGHEITSHTYSKPANARRKSILQQQAREGLPMRYALPLSILLIALMTWGLYHLQVVLIKRDHLPHIRPYASAYLIPIVLMTAVASRRAGWITLVLSVLAAAFALCVPALSLRVHNSRDCVELVLLTLIGGLVISGVEAMQQNRIMFADVTDAPQSEGTFDAIRSAAFAVPGVGAVHTCALRRRGFDIYVDLDFYLAPGKAADGVMTVAEASQIVATVENVVYQSHPLIFQVRARSLTPPPALLNSTSS